jgi:hypothetical protein
VRDAVLAMEGRPNRVESVREAVCSACGMRDTAGTCWRANRLECAFDRMLPAIIEHIEAQLARPA